MLGIASDLMQSTESRTTLIRHLRHELESVKTSCAKYEQLNATMTELEHSIKSLRDEREAEGETAHARERDLTERIREAEALHAELREEVKEADSAASEQKAKLDKLSSELGFLDGKEAGLTQKIENMSGFIEELAANHAALKDSIDFTRKEVAEMKANNQSLEKEQVSLEEKIAKQTFTKKTLLATLSDLELTEKRISMNKTEKHLEKEQTTLKLQRKMDQLMDLNNTLANLEEQAQYVDSERKRINEAHSDIEGKRTMEEIVFTDMQGDVNNLETRCRNTDDEQRSEDQRCARACDSFNDERERVEKNQRDAERLKHALSNMENISNKVDPSHPARNVHQPAQGRR